MEHVQQPTPVAEVGEAGLVVEVVSLGGPPPGEVVAAVVIQLVESDDEVPHPGGGQVGPHQDRAQGDRQDTVQQEVHRVTIGSGQGYRSSPVVMLLYYNLLSEDQGPWSLCTL